jgi:AmmeMemoRadiSam system protein B
MKEAAMDWSRPPAVADKFYPSQPLRLRSEVETFLKNAGGGDASETGEAAAGASEARPKALIAPHAGYVYSGPVAASAYVQILPFSQSVERVVLLGPAHRVPFRGLAGSSAHFFETPLGPVPVDREWLTRVEDLDQVVLLDDAHQWEHSLEVHLPFLQVALGDFRVVPLVVGDASPEEVAEVLKVLWGGPETLIVVSSDLSHYLPYAKANEVDGRTADAIVELRPEGLGRDHACGRIPVAGLLLRALEEGLSAECVDLRNSGDTAGPRDQVVGYGSFVFS